MENVDDKIKEYLLDKVQELEQQVSELVTQNAGIRLSKDVELKREIKEAKKKVFQLIKTTILDGCNGYWDYDKYGSAYMTDKSLRYLLTDIEKRVKEKFIEE